MATTTSEHATETGRFRRWRRGMALAGMSALASATAAGVGVATHYARRLTDPPTAVPEDPPRDADRVTLHAVTADHVLLAGPGADKPGTWGVATTGGYGRIGPTRERTQAGIRRPFTLLQGEVVPDHGVLDAYAHVNLPGDLHPDAVEVMVAGELGAMPAHLFLGDDVWVIGVHGRAAARHETFRMLAPAVAAGHSVLAVSYRNDQDAPPSPDGRGHLGATEWYDVAAAMDHARSHGAERIILVGCSMGGAVVGQVLARAAIDDVAGVLLDAPVVDWNPVVALAARDLGLPAMAVALLLGPTRAMARARHQVDLATLALDVDALRVPVLLVHGEADDVVPIDGSDALAHARPDLVTYLRVPGAGHVQSWNADPATYEAAVAGLLDAALGEATTGGRTGTPARRAAAGQPVAGAGTSAVRRHDDLVDRQPFEDDIVGQ